MNDEARCPCGDLAVAQALYRRGDGTHFLGTAFCAAHQVSLGRLHNAQHVEVIAYVRVVGPIVASW